MCAIGSLNSHHVRPGSYPLCARLLPPESPQSNWSRKNPRNLRVGHRVDEQVRSVTLPFVKNSAPALSHAYKFCRRQQSRKRPRCSKIRAPIRESSGPTLLRMLSWIVWFERLSKETSAPIATIRSLEPLPGICFFQECTGSFKLQLLHDWWTETWAMTKEDYFTVTCSHWYS